MCVFLDNFYRVDDLDMLCEHNMQNATKQENNKLL